MFPGFSHLAGREIEIEPQRSISRTNMTLHPTNMEVERDPLEGCVPLRRKCELHFDSWRG